MPQGRGSATRKTHAMKLDAPTLIAAEAASSGAADMAPELLQKRPGSAPRRRRCAAMVSAFCTLSTVPSGPRRTAVGVICACSAKVTCVKVPLL